MKTIKPTHPGAILKEYLDELGETKYDLSDKIGIPHEIITEILEEKRDISPEIALLLSRYFGVADGFWANLQKRYDQEIAKGV